MKDIVKSLKENATSRLKNPIVGAFVLAWCALNLNGLAIFILADNPLKLIIIRGKEWSLFYDALIPFIVACGYLLILPILNLAYEFINDGVFNALRNKHKAKRDKEMFLLQKETVRAKVESDEEYIRRLKDRDIDGWLEDQSKRNKEFINLKEKYSALIVTLNKKEQLQKKERKGWESSSQLLEEKIQFIQAENASKTATLETTLGGISNILDGRDYVKINNSKVK